MAQVFFTPAEMAKHISLAVRAKRLAVNLSQCSLSERSGVSLGVLKKFEQTGKISLLSLLKLALTLGCLSNFAKVFKQAPPETLATLDDLFKQKARKRGRR